MKIIATEDAPKAIGPYSQAIDIGNFLFCSGQIPLDPVTMKLVEPNIEPQVRQVFANMTGVLKAAGLGLGDVVKTTVFMADLNDFARMNAIYQQNFGDHKPARSTVQVAKLPLGALVEIECIAVRKVK
jgi:2-iminobutanoate/2-iminopropanoate deaminase